MFVSDQQREENYQEYLQLLKNPEYVDVSFDDQSGGISAVHRDHKFDKQMGPFGYRRGDYEKHVTSVLRTSGFRVLLVSEESPNYSKTCDGFLNDMPMDIKTVESNGAWSISSKLREAEKQGAEVVVIYFPEREMYSKNRVLDGIGKYENNPQIHAIKSITSCIIIAGDQVVDYLKKATTPSAEWF